MLGLDDPVGVDHAERVLPRVEARDLRQQRPLDVDSELVDDVGRVLGRERHVLRRQRVDRRRPDVGRRQVGRLRHVLLHVEDRRVVAAEPRQQEVEHLAVRLREVDVAAPDPVRGAVGEVLDHPGRLRVVDEHVVVLVGELLRVQGLEAAVDLLLRRRQAGRVALERVVDRLRRGEELVRAGDDPPLGIEPRVAHQRHERVVDLRHAAPEGRRRDVHQPLAAQGLREAADLLHQPARDDGRVVRERLLTDVDELQHQRPPRIAIRSGGFSSGA